MGSSCARLALGMLLAGQIAVAQSVGDQFRINTATTGFQGVPSVAAVSNVNYVVVWSSPIGGSTFVFGRQYSAAGALVGSEFRVNTDTPGSQVRPRVATDIAGNFTVVWTGPGTIWGQRFNFLGTPLGSGFRVDTSAGYATNPAVAYDGAGGFLVVWTAGDADGTGIFARKYASTGTATTAAFQVNSATTGVQDLATVGAYTGGFVVAWDTDSDPGDHKTGVHAQRLTSAGAGIGSEFRVNTSTTNYDDTPAIASQRFDGSFVIVWRGGDDGSLDGVFAQRFSPAGAPVGAPMLVNASTTSSQSLPAAAFDTETTFVVTWTNSTPSGIDVRGRQLSVNGGAPGPEFVVNSASGLPTWPAVAAPGLSNRFFVAFSDLDGDAGGVWGRLGCLVGDADGDGLVNVTDVFYLVNTLFAGGPAPVGCANVNGAGGIDVADVFYLINYLFAGGPPPV